MVEIQLDTYTVESISAHRKIRQDTLCFRFGFFFFNLVFFKCYAEAVFAGLSLKYISCFFLTSIIGFIICS